KGKEYVEKEAQNELRLATGDTCVLGPPPQGGQGRPVDAKLKSDILRLYVNDYKNTWKGFLSQFSVGPYTNLDDAIRKLNVLSDYKSPALGLLAFVSQNTYFSKLGPPTTLTEQVKQTSEGMINKLTKKADQTAERVREKVTALEPEDSLGQVTEAFDVAHKIV